MPRIYTKKTHCKRGHEFTIENTYIRRNGTKRCRACAAEKEKTRPDRKPGFRVYNNSPSGKAKRRQHRLSKMGWTLEMWAITLLEQGNVCALCRKPFTEEDPPCADHAHGEVPEPRGILHKTCNLGIANLGEDPNRCREAAEYLEAWN